MQVLSGSFTYLPAQKAPGQFRRRSFPDLLPPVPARKPLFLYFGHLLRVFRLQTPLFRRRCFLPCFRPGIRTSCYRSLLVRSLFLDDRDHGSRSLAAYCGLHLLITVGAEMPVLLLHDLRHDAHGDLRLRSVLRWEVRWGHGSDPAVPP